VHVDAPQSLIGQTAPVEIYECSSNSLFGRLVGGAGRIQLSSTAS
jgi:hypothetical protein